MGKKLLSKNSVIILIIVVAAGAVGYFYYYESQKQSLAEISKQSPTVQNYLAQHPNASYEIEKSFLTADGMMYSVSDSWALKEPLGSAGEPTDGKEHYCWVVRWYDPTSAIMSRIDVFIDKDSLKIVLVREIV